MTELIDDPRVFQYGRSDSYRVATTQDKDEKESPKKKAGKDMDDLKKEVPIVSAPLPSSCDLVAVSYTYCSGLMFTCYE